MIPHHLRKESKNGGIIGLNESLVVSFCLGMFRTGEGGTERV